MKRLGLPIPFTRTTITALSTLVLTSSAILVFSDAGSGLLDVPHNHPTAHVHDHADQTWPPQPPGRTNVIDRSDTGMEKRRQGKKHSQFSQFEQEVHPGSPLWRALGKRFRRITVTDDKEKDGRPRPNVFTYFSQDNNQTVEVIFDGAAVKSIKSIPASEYQPEIIDEEIDEAVKIARAHFLSLGLARVQQLKGFGILAYRPEGKGFYDTRVIYISFHANEDAPPEMVAWVDLTSQTVLNAREER